MRRYSFENRLDSQGTSGRSLMLLEVDYWRYSYMIYIYIYIYMSSRWSYVSLYIRISKYGTPHLWWPYFKICLFLLCLGSSSSFYQYPRVISLFWLPQSEWNLKWASLDRLRYWAKIDITIKCSRPEMSKPSCHQSVWMQICAAHKPPCILHEGSVFVINRTNSYIMYCIYILHHP